MTASSAAKHKICKPRLTARQRRIGAAGIPAIHAALAALARYERRKFRAEHPEGHFDDAKRWYPTEKENRGYIDASFRSPSRAHPYSYLLACRSLNHCENLHDVDHELVLDVRREAVAAGIESFNHDAGLADFRTRMDGLVLNVALPEAQGVATRARL